MTSLSKTLFLTQSENAKRRLTLLLCGKQFLRILSLYFSTVRKLKKAPPSSSAGNPVPPLPTAGVHMQLFLAIPISPASSENPSSTGWIPPKTQLVRPEKTANQDNSASCAVTPRTIGTVSRTASNNCRCRAVWKNTGPFGWTIFTAMRPLGNGATERTETVWIEIRTDCLDSGTAKVSQKRNCY